MATLASLGGNFTAAASWALCDANAVNDIETTSTALTTTPTDSTTFVPAAVAIDAVLIKIASRASGSPSNTITVVLRNTTTATDARTLTINVSDLDVCSTTDHAGGWYCFKFASTVTPNGTDSYAVRVSLSATTTAVSLWVSSGNNWARQVRTTTTQAPAAGDLLIIGGEFTGAGTGNNITITMDSTATTQYGTVRGTSDFRASVSVGKRGTMTYGTTASTNYVLRMAGSFVVYSSGTASIGTSGTPMPRTSTAVLEFVPTSSGDSGVLILNGSTFNAFGLSRTSGKNFVRTTLTADAAAAATTLNVADDTGWLNGDLIRLFPTARTASQGEDRTLSADAGASSMTITAGLTNLHHGTGTVAGEVCLYTRNVKIRSTTPTTNRTFVFADTTAITDIEWVEFQGLGSTNSQRTGIDWATTTGSFTLKFTSLRDFSGDLQTTTTNENNFTISDNIGMRNTSSSNAATWWLRATTSSTWTFTNNAFDANGQGFSSDAVFVFNSLRGTITGNRAAGCTGMGINVLDTTNPVVMGTFNNNVAHSNGNLGASLSAFWFANTIDGLICNRNGAGGLDLMGGNSTFVTTDLTIKNVTLLGNSGQNFRMTTGHFVSTIFDTWTLSSEASFTTSNGYIPNTAGTIHEAEWRTCTFGVTSGHTSADINLTSVASLERHSLWNCKLNSGTRINITANTLYDGSYIAETKKDQTAGAHQRTIPNRGTLATDTSTFHTASPSEKLTPNQSTAFATAGLKLRSSSKRCAVASGTTVTFSVWGRKDGSYAGTAAKLILRANPAVGISADTTLATAAAAANTWEQLTGTSASVTDDGVLEAWVEVDGTAGNYFVDDWSVS